VQQAFSAQKSSGSREVVRGRKGSEEGTQSTVHSPQFRIHSPQYTVYSKEVMIILSVEPAIS
jgi:hypothetical protein